MTEYAREYLEKGGNITNSSDLVSLAKVQLDRENEILRDQSLIICDSDILVLKIWCEEKFPPVPCALMALYQYHQYDFTLLCEPDIDWVYDPLRENELDRDRLFIKYAMELKKLNIPNAIISGKGAKRFELAKKIIEKQMNSM